MKHLFAILAILTFCLPAQAQHYDPEHRHSIEISTGLPPVHGLLLGSGDNARMYGGFDEKTHLRSCFNLGYTYTINEKWDFNFVLDAVAQFYTQTYYPKVSDTYTLPDGTVIEQKVFDFRADPISIKHGSRWWVSYNFDFRWKWYRSDTVRLYTAFGLGYVPGCPFSPVLPYIAPVGINWGARHFYGIAELNASPAASIILIGAGYRF